MSNRDPFDLPINDAPEAPDADETLREIAVDMPVDMPPLGADAIRDETTGVGDDAASGDERYRGGSSDPAFGFVLAIALSIGLTPVLPANADLRYTLAWGALAGVGVIAWLLGSAERIAQEDPANVGWGIGFGLLLATPFALFFQSTFGTASRLIFPDMTMGTVLAYLIFVMPLAETLFFRGLLQRQLNFWIVGVLGGMWSIVLFFPVMWGQIVVYPAVAAFLAIALVVMNLLYSYVRERNSLAAAWIAQIVASLILFFIPALNITLP